MAAKRTYWVDRSLGTKIVPQRLRDAGHDIRSYDEIYPSDPEVTGVGAERLQRGFEQVEDGRDASHRVLRGTAARAGTSAPSTSSTESIVCIEVGLRPICAITNRNRCVEARTTVRSVRT